MNPGDVIAFEIQRRPVRKGELWRMDRSDTNPIRASSDFEEIVDVLVPIPSPRLLTPELERAVRDLIDDAIVNSEDLKRSGLRMHAIATDYRIEVVERLMPSVKIAEDVPPPQVDVPPNVEEKTVEGELRELRIKKRTTVVEELDFLARAIDSINQHLSEIESRVCGSTGKIEGKAS